MMILESGAMYRQRRSLKIQICFTYEFQIKRNMYNNNKFDCIKLSTEEFNNKN